MVVTKPGNWKEEGKSECLKLGENVCGNAEEVMSSDLSDRSLPSLASKLSQVLGRCPQMVQNENFEREGTGKKKDDDSRDKRDENQSHERNDAKPKERIGSTVPSLALPDDPNEIQRLRDEFEKMALIFPEDDKDLVFEDESVLTPSVDSSQKQPTLIDADDRKPGLVQVAPTQPLTFNHCTLTIPLPGDAPVDESLLQKVTDDLAWFDNLVSVKAEGQVVQL